MDLPSSPELELTVTLMASEKMRPSESVSSGTKESKVKKKKVQVTSVDVKIRLIGSGVTPVR